MKKLVVFALSALCVVAPVSARAQLLPGCPRPNPALPFAFVVVNGTCLDLTAAITRPPGAKLFNLNTQVNLLGNTINVQATLNPDPFVQFGVTTVNALPTATSYSFLFGTPVVSGIYTSALSQANLDLTSGTGTTTVANSQTAPSLVTGYGSVDGVLTDLGVSLGTTPCTATGVAQKTTCNLGQRGNGFAPTFFNNLEALITYTQDNAGSRADFSGQVTLVPQAASTTAPEPATLALMGTGLLALGGWRSRRRRATV